MRFHRAQCTAAQRGPGSRRKSARLSRCEISSGSRGDGFGRSILSSETRQETNNSELGWCCQPDHKSFEVRDEKTKGSVNALVCVMEGDEVQHAAFVGRCWETKMDYAFSKSRF